MIFMYLIFGESEFGERRVFFVVIRSFVAVERDVRHFYKRIGRYGVYRIPFGFKFVLYVIDGVYFVFGYIVDA